MKVSAPLAALLLLAALSFSAGPLAQALGVSGTEADLSARFLPPSGRHLLGTDGLGRDLFVRLLLGGQVSLSVALAGAGIAAALGAAVGMLAGYAGGWRDAALMRLADFLIALPALPLLIILSAVNTGLGDLWEIVLLVSLLSWMTTARLARSRAASIRSMDYVRAARALGVGRARILLRHVFPSLSGTVFTAAALSAGNIVLLESSLSFLGLGIRPPEASWGNMLTDAGENIWDHAFLAVFPGLMIFATVLSFNLLGDRLRAAGQAG